MTAVTFLAELAARIVIGLVGGLIGTVLTLTVADWWVTRRRNR